MAGMMKSRPMTQKISPSGSRILWRVSFMALMLPNSFYPTNHARPHAQTIVSALSLPWVYQSRPAFLFQGFLQNGIIQMANDPGRARPSARAAVHRWQSQQRRQSKVQRGTCRIGLCIRRTRMKLEGHRWQRAARAERRALPALIRTAHIDHSTRIDRPKAAVNRAHSKR